MSTIALALVAPASAQAPSSLGAEEPLTATGSPGVPWPDGNWRGSAVFGGHVAAAAGATDVTGPQSAALTVSVAGGRAVSQPEEWALHDLVVHLSTLTAAADLTLSGGGSITGTASALYLTGNLEVHGNVTPNTPGPTPSAVQTTMGLPSSGSPTLLATWSACSILGGLVNLPLPSDVRDALGGDVAITAPLIATTGGAAPSLSDNLSAVEDAMSKAPPSDKPSAVGYHTIVQRITALYSAIAGACAGGSGATNGPPDRFPPGLYLAQLDELLSEAQLNQLSGRDLCDLLVDAIEIGVLGTSAPDESAAGALMIKVDNLLLSVVQDDKGRGDANDLFIVRATAAQMGLNDVADAAAKALRPS